MHLISLAKEMENTGGKMADLKLISSLTDAFGVPSQEGEIARMMEHHFREAGYRVEIDRLGNVIAKSRKCSKRPVMLAAHMDEIGLMVKFVTEKGFLKFIKMGGIDTRTLLNQRVLIKTEKGKIYGVIGHKPPHLQKKGGERMVPEAKDLFIDIGAKSGKEVEKLGIRIGTPIGFDMPMRKLENGRISAKALDDRVGCYCLLEIAKELKNEDVALVGTVQEEVSTFGKGAALLAYNIYPRAFIAIDVSIAGDHPEISEEEAGGVALEKGPVITLVEAGASGNVADRIICKKVVEAAHKAKIKYQLEVTEGGATDAATVYNVRGGIPSIAICVPARYIHSNVGVCSLKDIESTCRLLVMLAKGMQKEK